MIRLIVISIFFFSCTSSKNLRQDTIPFQLIAQEVYGGKSDSSFEVIEDSNSLEEVYALLSKSISPSLEVPKINFDRQIVIALFLGEKTSGGHSIIVEYVANSKDSISVNYKIKTPNKGEAVTFAMTQPYCIIKIPKTSKKIIFKEVE